MGAAGKLGVLFAHREQILQDVCDLRLALDHTAALTDRFERVNAGIQHVPDHLMFPGGKGAHDFHEIADQCVALDQQSVHVAEGRIRALIELGDQRVLRADLQGQPDRGGGEQPYPPMIQCEVGGAHHAARDVDSLRRKSDQLQP